MATAPARDAVKIPSISIRQPLHTRFGEISEEIELVANNSLVDDGGSFKSNTQLLQRHDSTLSLRPREARPDSDDAIWQVTNDSWLKRRLAKNTQRGIPPEDKSWTTSYLRAGPLLGLGALAFILLSIPISAILLAVSDGQAVEHWKVQPSVFISVITGVGNKAMAFASVQGAIVTWWVKALKGTTYRQLHYDWPYGTDLWGSFSMRHLSRLTMTALCGFIIFLDGILLQSATSTTERNLNNAVTLQVLLTPEIPTNYTAEGSLAFRTDDALRARRSEAMTPIYNNWIDHAAIPSPVRGCDGVCRVKVMAPALEIVECQVRESKPVNLTNMVLSNGTVLSPCSFHYGKVRCPSLDVQTQLAARPGAAETLLAGFGHFKPTVSKGGQNCAGNYTYTACWLQPIIAEYEIKTHNHSYIELDTRNPVKTHSVNNTSRAPYDVKETLNSTLGGIALLASMDNYTSIGLWSPNETSRYIDNMNTFHSKLMQNVDQYDNGSDCAPLWSNPVEDLMSTMNNLLFRTAVFATRDLSESELLSRIDPGLEINVSVQGTRIDDRPVFHTRWVYFYAATAVQVLCGVLVLTTYRDFWTLGREVTLSPLEIAKAFDAPRLRHLRGNGKAWELAELLGEERVRYGEVEVGGEGVDREGGDGKGWVLMFASPERVRSPGMGGGYT